MRPCPLLMLLIGIVITCLMTSGVQLKAIYNGGTSNLRQQLDYQATKRSSTNVVLRSKRQTPDSSSTKRKSPKAVQQHKSGQSPSGEEYDIDDIRDRILHEREELLGLNQLQTTNTNTRRRRKRHTTWERAVHPTRTIRMEPNYKAFNTEHLAKILQRLEADRKAAEAFDETLTDTSFTRRPRAATPSDTDSTLSYSSYKPLSKHFARKSSFDVESHASRLRRNSSPHNIPVTKPHSAVRRGMSGVTRSMNNSFIGPDVEDLFLGEESDASLDLAGSNESSESSETVSFPVTLESTRKHNKTGRVIHSRQRPKVVKHDITMKGAPSSTNDSQWLRTRQSSTKHTGPVLVNRTTNQRSSLMNLDSKSKRVMKGPDSNRVLSTQSQLSRHVTNAISPVDHSGISTVSISDSTELNTPSSQNKPQVQNEDEIIENKSRTKEVENNTNHLTDISLSFLRESNSSNSTQPNTSTTNLTSLSGEMDDAGSSPSFSQSDEEDTLYNFPSITSSLASLPEDPVGNRETQYLGNDQNLVHRANTHSANVSNNAVILGGKGVSSLSNIRNISKNHDATVDVRNKRNIKANAHYSNKLLNMDTRNGSGNSTFISTRLHSMSVKKDGKQFYVSLPEKPITEKYEKPLKRFERVKRKIEINDGDHGRRTTNVSMSSTPKKASNQNMKLMKIKSSFSDYNMQHRVPRSPIVYDESFDDPNSGYTEWEQWSACSKRCGIGRSERTRVCVKQDKCKSGDVEIRLCERSPC